MQINDKKEIVIIRQEANFDRACDQAHRQAIAYFGIDEDGYSAYVENWERSECCIKIDFKEYTRMGNQHHYSFIIQPIRETT